MPLKLTTYHCGNDIPDLPGNNVFHSKELFRIYEATSGFKPLFIVATEDGKPVAKLLAGIRRSRKWFPFSLIKQCVVFGEGEYSDDLSHKKREEIFGEMLGHLTKKVSWTCFMMEFRNLENAIFGYRFFRANHFFPINWLRVRNSLHSTFKAEDRFSTSRIRQIKKGLKNGAKVSQALNKEEIHAFSKMLRNVYSSRIRRYFPDKVFFHHVDSILADGEKGKIFIVKYKEKVIGGSVCIYSGDNAYLWFSGGMRKSYAMQYPGVLAVWAALKDAHERKFQHMEFMDVGLPFRKHGYRDFVLRFGGKQSSTRRWFRFRWQWVNDLMSKFYV